MFISGRVRSILISLAIVALGGCGGGRPIEYYTLQLPPAPQPSASADPVTILVGRINAPDVLEDEPIVYRSGSNEIGTYQYHQWVEPPVRMVRDILIRRLRASGKYRCVAELGSPVEGNFLLQGTLYDFEEVDTSRTAVLVTMEFELFDRRTHHIVWTHYYSHGDPVQGKEIPDVVSALDHNLEQGLSEVVASLDSYFSARFRRKS